MNRSTLFFAALAAVATAGTIAVPAQAGEAGKISEVRFSDLNLASADGAAVLKARIERAAKKVCTVAGDNTLDGLAQAKACQKVAVAKAMPQVELALAKAGTQLADAGRVSAAAK